MKYAGVAVIALVSAFVFFSASSILVVTMDEPHSTPHLISEEIGVWSKELELSAPTTLPPIASFTAGDDGVSLQFECSQSQFKAGKDSANHLVSKLHENDVIWTPLSEILPHSDSYPPSLAWLRAMSENNIADCTLAKAAL